VIVCWREQLSDSDPFHTPAGMAIKKLIRNLEQAMIINRVKGYLGDPAKQFDSMCSGTASKSLADTPPIVSEPRGPLSPLDINRMAWEQARQKVIAKRQIHNRIAKFFQSPPGNS